MAVYVDPLFDHWKANREGNRWCHMTADSLTELHEFAKKIGRKRCWYHGGRNHYDLTPSFRALAIINVAIEVDGKSMWHLIRALKR